MLTQEEKKENCLQERNCDIDILVTSRNGDRKIMQFIRTVELVEPVQRNNYRKDLNWLHFGDE